MVEIWCTDGSLDLLKCQTQPNQKPEVDLRRYGHPIVKSIWNHNSVGDHRILTKFGRLMQYHIPTTTKRSIWKPEAEFQYGDRSFLGIGSSNISAEDWYNYLVQILCANSFELSKTCDVTISVNGSKFATVWPPSWKISVTSKLYCWSSNSYEFGRLMQNHMPMNVKGQNRDREYIFNMPDVCF